MRENRFAKVKRFSKEIYPFQRGIFMKIAIMGYSGAGKSTLARELAVLYHTDVLHFDSVQFLPNWEVRDIEEKKRMTEEFMDTHDSWVIDGNYSKLCYERRMEEGDVIVLLLFNRFPAHLP